MRVILPGAAVAVAVAAIFLWSPEPVAQVNNWATDQVTTLAGAGKQSGRVVIAEIDEASLSRYGRWPWRRDLLGKIVRRILDDGAAAVALDTILNAEDDAASFQSTDTPAGKTNDEVLAGVMRGNPVVLGYGFRFDGATNSSGCAAHALPLAVVGPPDDETGNAGLSGLFHPSGVLCNSRVLSANASDEGFLNASADRDGKLRRVPLVMELGDRQYASLALAAFRTYSQAVSGNNAAMQLVLNAHEADHLRMGTEMVPLEGQASMRLRFRGPGRTFPYVPVEDVLTGRMPTKMLAGKIVLLGGSAIGLPGPTSTPADAHFPGVEVQATAIDDLISGDFLHRPASALFWEILLALCCGVACTLLVVKLHAWRAVWIVLAGVAAVWAGSAWLVSATGLLFSPLPVTVALLSNFPVVTVLTAKRNRRRAELTERVLTAARERSQEELRRSENRYRRLVENINDAIVVENADGQLAFANKRFRAWFEVEDGDMNEVSLDDFAFPQWSAAVRERHELSMRGQRISEPLEFEAQRPDRTSIWIEALVTPVEEEDDKITGTQWVLRDVTDRKRLEAELLQAQKMESIGRLAGGIAHDFNNLLTIINGYSAILLGRQANSRERQESLTKIHDAGERAAELTGNLLAFSRKLPVRLSNHDLNAVMKEVRDMLGPLLGEDIELVMRPGASPATVCVDGGQIHQVLTNLLVNARDAMPHGGRIILETKNVKTDAGAWVLLDVTDNGVGMTDEVRLHVFEPFYTTKDPGKGTGLGLATVYGIMQQNAGRVEVTSQPGEGTTFRLYFPEAGAHRTHATEVLPATDSANTQADKSIILVVEDEDDVRSYAVSVLSSAGYSVLQASGGPDGVGIAESFESPIHLLITDLVMPQMNGQELAVRLRESRPAMRVLYMSGYSEDAISERGIVSMEMAFMAKPFNPDQLLAKVRETLEVQEVVGKARAAGAGAASGNQ